MSDTTDEVLHKPMLLLDSPPFGGKSCVSCWAITVLKCTLY